MRQLAVLAMGSPCLLVACFSSNFPAGLACSESMQCPPGQVCATASNRCVLAQAPAGGGGGYDGQAGTGGSCAPPSAFVDGFDGATTSSMWAVSMTGAASISQAGGVVVLTSTGQPGFAEYRSTRIYDLTNGRVYLEVLNAFDPATSEQVYLRLMKDGANGVDLEESGGMLSVRSMAASVISHLHMEPYDATRHHWWQIRAVGGNLSFETFDAAGMPTFSFSAPSPAYLGAVAIWAGGGTDVTQAQGASVGSGRFDNFNEMAPSMLCH